MERNFCAVVQNSIKNNWEDICFRDFETQKSYRYCEVAEQMKKIQILFEEIGIVKGDKIALLGRNSSAWGTTFFSITTYGTVVVPILADFMPTDIINILEHSDSKILFVSNQLLKHLKGKEYPKNIEAAFILEDFSLLFGSDAIKEKYNNIENRFNERYPQGLKPETFNIPIIDGSEPVEISYTSGTSGNSKGVVLSHHNLFMNAYFAIDVNMPIYKGDKKLALLPLAHAYALAFELMFPFIQGVDNTFLTKLPTPNVLIGAMEQVKPVDLLVVPLILEKIYFNKIKPIIAKPHMQILLTIPFVNNLIYRKINGKLLKMFGGNLYEVIIGGAALNPRVEEFFRKIGFPMTIGYGMTECGPLISYCPYYEFRSQSCGRVIRAMDVRIDSEDQYNIPGEIQVKGEHVMIGYYKNPEATKAVFTEDGWLKTGDMGIIDMDKNIYIKGRCKSMLLGPSGQNIYPEEIEAKFVNFEYIEECIAIQRGNRIVIIAYPKWKEAEDKGLKHEDLEKLMEVYRKMLNQQIPAYMGVSYIELIDNEFEKTPKKSIKRFLYS